MDDEYTCRLCGVLDEEALREELRALRQRNRELRDTLVEDAKDRLFDSGRSW